MQLIDKCYQQNTSNWKKLPTYFTVLHEYLNLHYIDKYDMHKLWHFLDIDLKEASKVFSSKFSCGSSVTGDDEIVIQGDVSDDLFDFLPEKWPQVIKNSTKINIIRINNFKNFKIWSFQILIYNFWSDVFSDQFLLNLDFYWVFFFNVKC